MSFRLFIYYCALCGGWAAFVGWLIGRMLSPSDPTRVLAHDAVMGFALGLSVALGLGLMDSVWNLGMRQPSQVLFRVGVGILIGSVGGLIGGLVGHLLNLLTGVLFALGWTLTGALVGASIGGFEALSSFITKKETRSARKKFLRCMTGGAIGGLLGGMLALLVRGLFTSIMSSKSPQWLLSPTAIGFVILGACIGLLVATAQVLLKEAWIKVESGFRAGREMILAKENIMIGRAEGSDVALFGDSGVEKNHANIIQENGRYFIEDMNSQGGTYINDQPLRGRAMLQTGDLIRVGRSVLRFYERQKKSA